MRIATWNVNSVRARLPRLLPWLAEQRPDVVCLQETKVVDELFPTSYLEDQGYDVVAHGQKTYNGVAILARRGIRDVVRGFPDDAEDAQARAIAATIDGWRILNLYVPNGAEVGHEKYQYKLAWLERLRRYLDEAFCADDQLVVCGDFNITFDDRDIHDPAAWHEQILCSTPERDALRRVLDFGLFDALRKHHAEAGIHTWWDMRTRAFARGAGLRIDHFLVSRSALDACSAVDVDLDACRGKSPSDHAPVIATFE